LLSNISTFLNGLNASDRSDLQRAFGRRKVVGLCERNGDLLLYNPSLGMVRAASRGASEPAAKRAKTPHSHDHDEDGAVDKDRGDDEVAVLSLRDEATGDEITSLAVTGQGVADGATEKELTDVLGRFGPIKAIRLSVAGFAHVQYVRSSSAYACLQSGPDFSCPHGPLSAEPGSRETLLRLKRAETAWHYKKRLGYGPTST